jgi:glycosyltransferase involved in cell wall biosynthesis
VIADSGGLPEVVNYGKSGMVTQANNPGSLAWGILEVLNHPDYAQDLVEKGFASLKERFDWADLAQQTEDIFKRVVTERSRTNW